MGVPKQICSAGPLRCPCTKPSTGHHTSLHTTYQYFCDGGGTLCLQSYVLLIGLLENFADDDFVPHLFELLVLLLQL